VLDQTVASTRLPTIARGANQVGSKIANWASLRLP
jgi:hypothetical protein